MWTSWPHADGLQWTYHWDLPEWGKRAVTQQLQCHTTKKSLKLRLPCVQKLPFYRTKSCAMIMCKDGRNCYLLTLTEMILKWVVSMQEDLLRLFFIVYLFPLNRFLLCSKGRWSTVVEYSICSFPSTSKAGEFLACPLHISQHLLPLHNNLPYSSTFLFDPFGRFALLFIIFPSPFIWNSFLMCIKLQLNSSHRGRGAVH